MYGWLETDNNNNIEKVSVKDPLNDPKSDPIILGVFTLKILKPLILLPIVYLIVMEK